jgi:hypothetical protein
MVDSWDSGWLQLPGLRDVVSQQPQIEAAREMAKAKGGDVPDVSRLTAGEFYLAAEGAPPAKIRTPLSLSHHPRSPLTVEEVLKVASQ